MKILTLVFSILLLTSFMQKEEVYIWYPHELGVVQTCNGQEVELLIEVTTEATKKIKVHSFSLDKSMFTIYLDNKAFTETDTITLSKNKTLHLKVKYKLLSSDKPKTFTFKTDIEKYSNNQIKLSYGQFLISTNDIREKREQIINISESCQDSIKVFFPYGGTVSSATLYNDSIQTKKEFKSVSYRFRGGGNYMMFSKEDIGRYYVDYGSCHWGGEFWLRIK